MKRILSMQYEKNYIILQPKKKRKKRKKEKRKEKNS